MGKINAKHQFGLGIRNWHLRLGSAQGELVKRPGVPRTYISNADRDALNSSPENSNRRQPRLNQPAAGSGCLKFDFTDKAVNHIFSSSIPAGLDAHFRAA